VSALVETVTAALFRVCEDNRIGAGGERVDVLTRSLQRHAWQHRSAGVGAKGERWYSWALINITDSDADAAAGQHHLLVRARL
jgi:hypothetical protein